MGVAAGASIALCVGFIFGVACSYVSALKKSGEIKKSEPLEPGITGMYD